MSTTGEPFPPVNEPLSAPEAEQGMRRRAEQLARTMGAAGVQRIAAERQRQQLVKGYTLDHDRGHTHGELVAAARSYLLAAEQRSDDAVEVWPFLDCDAVSVGAVSQQGRETLLAKAGAMIAAELDRVAYERTLRESSRR